MVSSGFLGPRGHLGSPAPDVLDSVGGESGCLPRLDSEHVFLRDETED